MPTERLFQRCPICGGTLSLNDPARPRYQWHSACPCNQSPTPGWAQVGLTLGQVEKIIADRDRLLVLLADVLADPDSMAMVQAKMLLARRAGEIEVARAKE